MEHEKGDAATLVMTLPHGTTTMHLNPHKIVHKSRFVRFTKEGRVYTRSLWIFRNYLSVPAARAYLTQN